MTFELQRSLRETLWNRGLSGIESALRYAAVELDRFMLSTESDLDLEGDDAHRHFVKFLAWSDSALVGVNEVVRRAGDQTLMRQWEGIENPLRRRMHSDRNLALKGRAQVIAWEELFATPGGATFRTRRFLNSEASGWEEPVIGTCYDYLVWIRDVALPLALNASRSLKSAQMQGARTGMPYPESDPWTTRTAWEIRLLMS